jgi:hypothetical protein
MSSILAFIKTLEDALLYHITGYNTLNATDPLIFCAKEFTRYAEQVKTSPQFVELIAEGYARLFDEGDRLQKKYAYTPAALIKVCIRFFSAVAKCDPRETIAHVALCLVVLGRSTHTDIDTFDFTAETEVFDFRKEDLTSLFDDASGIGSDKWYCEHALYIDCTGNRNVRGYYTQTFDDRKNACYISSCGKYSLEKVAIPSYSEISLWQITERSTGLALYACSSHVSSSIPPNVQWVICDTGAGPPPIVFFVPIPRRMSAAIINFGGAKLSANGRKSLEQQRGERKSFVSHIFSPDGRKILIDVLTSLSTKPNINTNRTDQDNTWLFVEPNSPKESRIDMISDLQNEINVTQKRNGWVKRADAKDICVGFDDPFEICDVTILPGNEFSSSWLISNMVQKQKIDDTFLVANQCAQQLIEYKTVIMHFFHRACLHASCANILGVVLIGPQASPRLEYVVRYDVPQFSEVKGSLGSVFRLTQSYVVNTLLKASAHAVSDARVENATDMDCISMGFDEATEGNDIHAHVEMFRRLDSCSQALNAAAEEAILSGIRTIPRKAVTTRINLSIIANVHEAISHIFASGIILPELPDLSLIRIFEDELVRSFNISDSAESLSVTDLTNPNFAVHTQIPLNADILHSIQRYLSEIQRYLNEIFAFLDALDQRNDVDSGLDLHCSTGFAVASLLLATCDINLDDACSSISDAGLKTIDWRRLFFTVPRGMTIELGLDGTHKSLCLLLSDDEILSEQDGLCIGCGVPIHGDALFGFVKKRNYRRCTFSDALFCKQWCHKKDMHALPMNLLWNLDETKYSVSRQAYASIRRFWDKPLIPLARIHPEVIKRAPYILSMQQERLSIMKRMRSVLRSKESFNSVVGKTIGIERLYMCFTADLFSFADLSPPSMQETLSNLQLLRMIL